MELNEENIGYIRDEAQILRTLFLTHKNEVSKLESTAKQQYKVFDNAIEYNNYDYKDSSETLTTDLENDVSANSDANSATLDGLGAAATALLGNADVIENLVACARISNSDIWTVEIFSQKIYLLGSYDVFRCVCTTV